MLMVALMALPAVHGLMCGYASLQGDCEAIFASDLSAEEQREALAALLANGSWEPAHESALAWNRQVLSALSGKPLPGVSGTSQGSIRNAWVKLLPPNPSVLREGVLYHSGDGSALLGHGYAIVPYAGTIPGDCKTVYRPQPVGVSLRLLVNGQSQGEGMEVPYRAPYDARFTAQLDVSQTTYVDRYRTQYYCCRYRGGWCVYCSRCALSTTETRYDHVLIEDSLEAKLLTHEPDASLTPLDQYGDTVQALFTPDPEANTRLQVGALEVLEQGEVFSLSLAEPPLETLTVSATRAVVRNRTLALPSSATCELTVQGPFQRSTLSCSTSFSGPRLSLATDRLFYKAGESIVLAISPPDAEATITYANRTYPASSVFAMAAVPGASLITGWAFGQEAYTVVGVSDGLRWRLLVQLLLLALLASAVLSAVRSRWAAR